MTDTTIRMSLPSHRRQLISEVDGPADDAVLEVSVTETVELDEDGATRGVPTLTLRTGVEGIELQDRDQILELQAIINRAVNQWRLASPLPEVSAGDTGHAVS